MILKHARDIRDRVIYDLPESLSSIREVIVP